MTEIINIGIIGAGGFGREVYQILDKDIYNCVGFVDGNNNKSNLPVPILGDDNQINQIITEYEIFSFFIAIGAIKSRIKIYNKLNMLGVNFPSIKDKASRLFSNTIAEGVIVYPYTSIMQDSVIGKFSLINSGVTIGHDTSIGEFCNINPGTSIAGNVTIGNGSFIGIGASIKENITIGDNVIVGAGSVVTKDIEDNVVSYGVPAKIKEL